MKLIIGLGNPGPKYQLTRHNVGFMAVDLFVNQLTPQPLEKKEQKASTYKARFGPVGVLFAKPQTFMNLSGQSVSSLIQYYQVPLENVLILHDEVDLDFGQIRLQKSRGHGGHNGIRNIHQLLASNEYCRLRIGVGRPKNLKMDTADFVLQEFSEEEKQELPELLNEIGNGIESFIKNGFSLTANTLNKKKGEPTD